MSTHSFGRVLRSVGALLALGASGVSAQAAQGTINVRVTETAGNRPLEIGRAHV